MNQKDLHPNVLFDVRNERLERCYHVGVPQMCPGICIMVGLPFSLSVLSSRKTCSWLVTLSCGPTPFHSEKEKETLQFVRVFSFSQSSFV
jgi:hypothetical protein